MGVLARATVYATLFVAFVLVFIPNQVLEWSGVTPVVIQSPWQIGGMLVTVLGAALALWCVLAFAFVGKGTPAPFDPPRRLVVRGPYRFVRNPMYIGAAIALAGAALVWRSWALFGYTLVFLAVAHTFVVFYEEPTLRRLFGEAYARYCHDVHRWRPRRGTRS
jgi:protein-S-isoprenylcysteine O-methyltransferase Ste14